MQEMGDADDITTETPSNTPSDDAYTRLIHAATSSGNSKLPPGDIHCVISKASKTFVNKCEYLVSKHDHIPNMLLVDRGANGGVAGNDVCVLFKTFCTANIKGIDNHQLTNVPIGEPLVVLCQHKKVLLLPLCISMHCLVKVHPFMNHVN
jgi:hypothetical protein